MVMEANGATGVTKGRYLRGTNLLAQEIDGVKYYYTFNAHGDVIQCICENGDAAPRYDYDAFGNQLTINTDPNPFRYCGEYWDGELIYIRAGYYDSKTGGFISEDSVRSTTKKLPNETEATDPLSLNLYTYCRNDPVRKIDPSGLFDYDSVLSVAKNASKYNVDVKVLQQHLIELGLLNKDSVRMGFNYSTSKAVSKYQANNGLSANGIVTLATWTDMGMIYRTKGDIQKGVEIFTDGDKQYFDVTRPMLYALEEASSEAKTHRNDWIGKWFWFHDMVNHNAPWDIKRKDSWENTIQTTYPGAHDAQVVFKGGRVTPEYLGNYMYGYTGAATGIKKDILIAGSIYAAGGISMSEILDHPGIYAGYQAHNKFWWLPWE